MSNPGDTALDLRALAAAYEERVRELCKGSVPPALELRDRLAPEQWRLEWHLPWWVGGALGLDADTCRELALCNVLGVVAMRLRDDVADGELDGLDARRATALANLLLEAALEPYRARLDEGSSFWTTLAGSLADGRGAPLKASALGACLLADRADAYPPLGRCLDHALRALVLYDHAADWQADLQAGRPNEFIDHLLGATGQPIGATSHADVLVALMTTGRGATYFEAIDSELAAASALAQGSAIGGLAEHLRALTARFERDGLAMQAHYVALGNRAAVLFMQEEG